MGINNVSNQKTNLDFNNKNVLNNQNKSYSSFSRVDKTPQADTVELSNKKDTIKKVAIGAAIVGTAVGLFYLLRGKKPPKKVMEQAADAVADTKPKMEITEEAKKIYDDVAPKFHKKTTVTSETIEYNLKPKEKAGSWSSDDMKDFYSTLEKESDAKIAAEKAAKEAEAKAAKEAEAKLAKEAAEKAAKEAQLQELRQYNVTDLNEKYVAASKVKDYDTMYNIEKVQYEKFPDRIKALESLPKSEIKTAKINYNSISSDEYHAVAEYVDAYPYNSALRNGQFDGKELPKSVQLMDNVIEKSKGLEDDAYVYRAVGGYLESQAKFMDSIKEGAIITDKSFVSTAKNIDRQFKYFLERGNSIAMRIKLPKGTKGINVNESEFILPRGAQIKVNSIDKVNGIADCEYILPNKA